jgi:hypothetical protein
VNTPMFYFIATGTIGTRPLVVVKAVVVESKGGFLFTF